MDASTQGICPKCDEVNALKWVWCDSCGARLPWAPPEARRTRIAEMTDEQLNAIYAPLPKREPFFLFTPRGRPFLYLVVGALLLLWHLLA